MFRGIGKFIAGVILTCCMLAGNRAYAMSSTAQSDADYRTPELIALAAGLKNDRELIFQWVRKNIKYVQYYGCKKGAYLTYLERSGNDADQSALLVALWRAAGISCQYVWGWVEMPISDPNSNVDWYHYLGADGTQEANSSNGFTSQDQLVELRGEPSYGWWPWPQGPGTSSNVRGMARVWVQANVSGSAVDYDPSFKLIQPVSGLDVASIMGYDRTSLLNSLGTGTAGIDSITGLSYSGLSTYLSGCASQFIANYKGSYFTKAVEEVVGGWKSLPNSIVDNNNFPIAAAGYNHGILTTNGIPSTNDLLDGLTGSGSQGETFTVGYATIQLKVFLASDTGHVSPLLTWGAVNTAILRGGRLGLVSESNKLTLKLDDTQVAQAASTTTAGTALDIVVDINQSGGTYINSAFNLSDGVMKAKAGGSYALVYGFDVSSDYLSARQKQLASYKEQGVSDTDPRVVLETLNVIGLQWLLETDAAHGLIGNLKNLSSSFLYRFGRAAQEAITGGNAVYVDLPFNYSGYVSRVPDAGAANTLVADSVYSFISSAMENGVLEQLQGAAATAVSTVKILKIANDQAVPVYLASLGNWSSVQSQLTGYTTGSNSDISHINDDITAGASVLLPKSGQMTQSGWQWKGPAYASILWNANGLSYWKMIIGQTYSGGFTASTFTTNPSWLVNQSNASTSLYQPTHINVKLTYGLDPVDLASGNFTHQRELLTAGDGVVRGLDFSVSYNGGNRTKNDAKVGYGWTHSYYVRATELADVDGAFGKKTPVEMAATLAGVVAATDVFTNRIGPKFWLGTVLITNWTVDQLTGSAVSIVSGDKIWQFHKQADGTYAPPPGATQTLAKVSNLYQLTERNGPTWKFDASNRLSEIDDLWTKKLLLTYNTSGTWADTLATVTDAYGRKLTFAYGTNGLSSVTDNSSPARSVSFSVNPSYDLIQFCDAETKFDFFDYVSGHLISNYRNDANDTVVSNTYDSQGRVLTQDTMGDTNKRWHLYYAPGQTIEEEPGGAITTHYFDDLNREVETDNALGHRMLTTYDAHDRVTKKERIVGSGVDEVTTYTYDVNNNPLTETDPKGKTTTNTYASDGSNHLTSTTDKRGNTTSFQSYNAQHQPTQVTDREGRVTTYTYKAAGDPGAGSVDTVSEGGNTTTYGYDAKGALYTITYPGGAGESMVNNFLGDPTTKTDELGRQTTISYNNRREVISTTAPGAGSGTRTTTTTYDNKRDVASVTNPRGYATGTVYSVTHKLLTTTLPDGSVTTNHYNIDDRLDWVSNPLGMVTSFGLDGLGRTTAVTDPLSRTTTTTYQDDQRRTIAQSPAPLNIQTKATVDERGQVIRDEDGLGNYAQPGYDNNGNKVTWVDRRGKTWTFTYDKEDRLKNTTTPLSRTIAQAWNARGLLDSITEPSGQVTSFGYDGRRRLTSKTDGVGVLNYEFDDAGQLLTVTTQGGIALTRTYHPSGEVASFTNANNETISYDYDKNGNLTSLTYPTIAGVPGGTVNYEYDNRDRLVKMTDWSGRVTTYTWDAAGRLTGIARPNGTKRALRWDAAGQMLAVEERPASGTPLAVRSFGYDSAGRITKRISYPQATAWTEPTLNAGVDDDNRLTGGVLNYDADGNTLASLLPDGPWGASGTSTNASGTFGWNARNQLTSVTRGDNSQQVTYDYDAEGNLLRTTDSSAGVTRWITDPNGGNSPRVLARYAPSGSGVTRYIYGIGLAYEIRADGSVRYYHYDQVGSTIALTDSTGAVTGRADYSPYGAVQSTSGELATQGATPFLFVGAFGVITDSTTGLHNMRARWYSSYLRRFLNEDPSGFSGGENFYAYADGNPISLIDPTGKYAIWDDLIFMGVGGVVGVAAQGIADLATGKLSGTGDYASAFASGAVGGEATLYGGPIAGGAAAALANNYIHQQASISVGNQKGFDVGSAAKDTFVGGAVGALPVSKFLPKWPGVNAGRNSFEAVTKSTVTKLSNGTIKSFSFSTAIKITASQTYNSLPDIGTGAFQNIYQGSSEGNLNFGNSSNIGRNSSLFNSQSFNLSYYK